MLVIFKGFCNCVYVLRASAKFLCEHLREIYPPQVSNMPDKARYNNH